MKRSKRYVHRTILIVSVWMATCASLAQAQPAFENATEAAGFPATSLESFAVAWMDYNGDGWLDLWLGNHALQLNAPSLFINNMDGTFEKAAESLYAADPAIDTHGAAWADFDNDGDLDYLEVTGAGRGVGGNPQHLFVQDETAFQEQATLLHLDFALGRGRMPLWFDYDQDGLLDALITTTPRSDGIEANTALWRQDANHTFEDVSAVEGLILTSSSQFALLTDVTGDDVHDLLLDGGPFPEIIYQGGISSPLAEVDCEDFPSAVGSVQDAASADVNGDLKPDIIMARRKLASSLAYVSDTLLVGNLRNTATPTLERLTFQAEAEVRLLGFRDTGVAAYPSGDTFIGSDCMTPDDAADITLDPSDVGTHGLCDSPGLRLGYDPMTSTWTVDLNAAGEALFSVRGSGLTAVVLDKEVDAALKPVLWRSSETGYTSAATAAGLGDEIACTGVVAADFDNDMDVDLYFACAEGITALPSRLYENTGDGTFVEVTDAGGAQAGVGAMWNIHGGEARVATGDYDLDGYLDLILPPTPPVLAYELPMTWVPASPTWLYRNAGGSNHWLQIDLIGTTSNRNGIGATVYAYTAGKAQMREQNGGVHRFAQNAMRIHFGLADHSVVDSLHVIWPSGTKDVFRNLEANQLITVTEGEAAIDTGVEISDPSGLIVDELFLYPNPVQSQATVVVRSRRAKPVAIRVVDVLGRIVHDEVVFVQGGENTIHLATDGLTSGTYFLRADCGDAIQKIAFVVAR